MSRRPKVRYLIRNERGEELVCPSLADLHALYVQGFLSDEDLVRPEGSTRWVRAGALPALHGVREDRADPRKLAVLVMSAALVALAIFIALRWLR
jgi:hypothetical protein